MSLQNCLMIEKRFFQIGKHCLVSCFSLVRVLGNNKGKEQSTPFKAFHWQTVDLVLAHKAKQAFIRLRMLEAITLIKTVQEIPRCCTHCYESCFAESAGSLLMHRCGAIDSLLDVLKRFPALCC